MRRILALGTYDAKAHPRVEVLCKGLASYPQLEVRELNLPLELSTAARVAMLKQPWRMPQLLHKLATRWSQLAAGSRRYRRAYAPDAILVGYMGHFDVLLARTLYPHTPIILDHLIFAAGTARDRGVDGLKVRLLQGLDAAATRSADVIVVDTAEHKAQLTAPVRERGVVVPVGASRAWYQAGKSAQSQRKNNRKQNSEPLRIVFFGLFTPLQGTPVIAQALRLLYERQVPVHTTLIGTGQQRGECEAILAGVSNVTWVDWVDGSELPSLVASHDVCLGIMGTTPKALNVVPNKVYQGLAAGCAVVTSATAPQQRALGAGAIFVAPGSAVALADALTRLATVPEALTQARARARQSSANFTCEKVVAPLVAHLQQLLEPGKP